jgi:hypothetical protein
MATGPACFCPLEGQGWGTRLNGLGKQATVVVSLKLCGSLIVPRKSVTKKVLPVDPQSAVCDRKQ